MTNKDCPCCKAVAAIDWGKRSSMTEQQQSAALAALDEVIPPHLRTNRHGENFMGQRYATIRAALLSSVPLAQASDTAEKRDAERYRWLRKQTTDVACVFTKVEPGYMVALDRFRVGTDLDAAVDAAMAGKELP